MAKIKRQNLTLGITLLVTLLIVSAHQQVESHSSIDASEQLKAQNVKTFGSGLITRCEHPGTGGFFISRDAFPYSRASIACAAQGGYLADLSARNFLLASDIVLTCNGPNNRAWIRYAPFFFKKNSCILLTNFLFLFKT